MSIPREDFLQDLSVLLKKNFHGTDVVLHPIVKSPDAGQGRTQLFTMRVEHLDNVKGFSLMLNWMGDSQLPAALSNLESRKTSGGNSLFCGTPQDVADCWIAEIEFRRNRT